MSERWDAMVQGRSGVGDFNGDGYDDLAVSVPGQWRAFTFEPVSTTTSSSGCPSSMSGRSSKQAPCSSFEDRRRGLTGSGSVEYWEGTPGIPGTAANEDSFGFAAR